MITAFGIVKYEDKGLETGLSGQPVPEITFCQLEVFQLCPSNSPLMLRIVFQVVHFANTVRNDAITRDQV